MTTSQYALRDELFADVPVDIILAGLSPIDVASVAGVCKSWRDRVIFDKRQTIGNNKLKKKFRWVAYVDEKSRSVVFSPTFKMSRNRWLLKLFTRGNGNHKGRYLRSNAKKCFTTDSGFGIYLQVCGIKMFDSEPNVKFSVDVTVNAQGRRIHWRTDPTLHKFTIEQNDWGYTIDTDTRTGWYDITLHVL